MKTQTFGIELEMNGILRTKAAQTLAELFGTEASFPDRSCYHTQTVSMPDGRVWKVMRDSSIPGPEDEKTEVVSPICRWEDIETVQNVVRALAGPERRPTPRTAESTCTSALGNTPPRPSGTWSTSSTPRKTF